MPFVTCQTLYEEDKLLRYPQLLPESARDQIWQAILCGLPNDKALAYATKIYSPPPGREHASLVKEVGHLYTLYNRGCASEFASLALPVSAIIGTPENYQRLRPLMLQAVPEPVVVLSDIHQRTVFGKHVNVSTEFGERLADAEKLLRRKLADRPEDLDKVAKFSMGGFQWRERAGTNEKKFTNHMLGRAIDIEETTNPQFSQSVAEAADEILAFTNDRRLIDPNVPGGLLRYGGSIFQQDLKKTVASGREAEILAAYVRLRLMSDVLLEFLRSVLDKRAQLMNVFNDPSRSEDDRRSAGDHLRADRDVLLADQLAYTLSGGTIAGFNGQEEEKRNPCHGKDPEDPDGGRQQCIDKGYRVFARWLPRGIITLPVLLVVSFIETGLKWGGEYPESKDPMHFEDPARDRMACQKALQVVTKSR